MPNAFHAIHAQSNRLAFVRGSDLEQAALKTNSADRRLSRMESNQQFFDSSSAKRQKITVKNCDERFCQVSKSETDFYFFRTKRLRFGRYPASRSPNYDDGDKHFVMLESGSSRTAELKETQRAQCAKFAPLA